MGSFFNTGQTCTASKRIFIHESIYQPFLQAMADYIANDVEVGDGDEQKFLLGPIQNSMQYNKVKDIFEDCKDKGYKFVAAKDLDVSDSAGYFVRPVVIDNPPTESRIMQEEPFGMLLLAKLSVHLH